MADTIAPEVKVVLTAEDQGVSAAIRQLGQQLGNLKTKQDEAARSAQKLGLSFRDLARQSLDAVRLRIANIPGLGEFGSILQVRAFDPLGKQLEEGAGALEASLGAAGAAVAGVTGGLIALGVAAAAVDDHMMHLARSITNTSFATGLSVRQVQEWTEVSKEMDVDADAVFTALSRLNVQLGESVVLGEKGSSGSDMFVKTLKELGVQTQITAGQSRPLNEVLADFYDKLQKIPDDATRVQTELTAFGQRSRALVQIFEEIRRSGLSVNDVLHSIDATGNVMENSQIANVIRSEQEWEHLKGIVRGFFTELGADVAEATLSWRGFERAIATTVLALGTTIPGKDADALVNKLLPLPGGAVPGATGGTGSASFLALQQIAQTNEQLAERVAVLKAGGENQEKLKEAEASYAAAVKTHNDALVKAYGTEIASLKEIIALEAGKKKGAAEGGALDAANKAALALALKQQQDLLEIAKAGAAEREEVEKGEYERGLISVAQYYGDRKQAVQDGTAQEIAALQKEREQLVQSADLAGNRALEARTGAAKTPADKQRLAAEADKFNAEQLEALARIDELDTRITVAQMNSRKELSALENEQYRAELEHKQKILDMEEKIGLASEKEFDARAAETQQSMQETQNRREAIQIRLNDGAISEREAQRETKQLLQEEIPLLRQKADLELEAAMASGDAERIAQAQQAIEQIQKMDDELKKPEQTLRQASGAMAQHFADIAKSATSTRQAFQDMELEVIHSLEAVVEQMLVNAITGEAIDAQTRLSSAKTAAANTYKWVSDIPFVGWIIAPAAAAAAFATVLAFKEGGAVSGPGGVDRVPAMLTAGEFVVNAEAAKNFGFDNLHAINAGEMPAFADRPSFATPSDFSSSRFEMPEAFEPAAARVSNVNNEIHLHHTGPDALEVLRGQLVPELKKSFRNGQLDFIAP